MMGEHEQGLVGDIRISWKTVVSQRLDSKRLKQDKPDLYNDYVKNSVSRRFLVS